MTVATVDDRGRVYIPKEIREKYGGKFRIVETSGELLFIPLPDDPMEAFQEGEELESKSLEQLKKEISQGVKEQVSE